METLWGRREIFAYYDVQSITRPSKNIVRVWERTDYTEMGVLKVARRAGREFRNLKYSQGLYEINCAEKTLRMLSDTKYNNRDEVIYYRTSPLELGFIVPESTAENLYKAVCK